MVGQRCLPDLGRGLACCRVQPRRVFVVTAAPIEEAVPSQFRKMEYGRSRRGIAREESEVRSDEAPRLRSKRFGQGDRGYEER